MTGRRLVPEGDGRSRRCLAVSTTVAVSLTVLATLSEAYSPELADSAQDAWVDGRMGVMLMVLSGAVILVAVVLLVLSCTDCYKSEVSTDFHPATAGASGAKWGGAGGYTAAASTDVNDTIMGAGFTGEVVVPGEGGSQPLPYAMIPAQVPEARGFCGYGAATEGGGGGGYGGGLAGYGGGGGGGGGGGLAGYGGGGGGGGAGHMMQTGLGGPQGQRRPGAHVSPLDAGEPQERPPSYYESHNR